MRFFDISSCSVGYLGDVKRSRTFRLSRACPTLHPGTAGDAGGGGGVGGDDDGVCGGWAGLGSHLLLFLFLPNHLPSLFDAYFVVSS